MTIATDNLLKQINGKELADKAIVIPEGKPRYEIITAYDALQPQPAIEWVVDRLISAGSVNIFYGDGGTKKTWALLFLAVCVATGNQWLDFQTMQKPALIIDEESGKARIKRRIAEALRGHYADDNTPVSCVSVGGFNLGDAFWIGELTNLINSLGAGLVIIDALADVMPGKDENAVKDVQPVFLTLRRIAEDTQAAIVIIHHSNKGTGKDNYRGSTAIKGAIDTLIKVESEPEDDLINFETTKVRDEAPVKFAAMANRMTIEPKSFWLTSSEQRRSGITATCRFISFAFCGTVALAI